MNDEDLRKQWESDLRAEWGGNVKRARGDISKAALANKIGCHPTAIMLIENGDRFPSESMKMRLAKALGCSIGELFPYRFLRDTAA